VGKQNTGVTVEGNVAKLLLEEGVSTIGDNYIYGRWADLSKLFQGTEGSDWSDFLPVKGSPIDFSSGMGAVNFLSKLLAGDDGVTTPVEPVVPVPTDPEENAQTPDTSVPTPALLSVAGYVEFGGRAADALHIAHDEAFEISEGTLAFGFNADSVGSRRTIFAKNDVADGDHMSIWVQEGHLKVSFENGEDEMTIASGKVLRSGRDYDVAVSFDGDRVGVYLDGKLVGDQAFDMDWSNNHEDISLGAGIINLDRTSSPGAVYSFDGTLSDFALYDHTLTPEELASLQADELAGYSLS
jgi:hypothetical protein